MRVEFGIFFWAGLHRIGPWNVTCEREREGERERKSKKVKQLVYYTRVGRQETGRTDADNTKNGDAFGLIETEPGRAGVHQAARGPDAGGDAAGLRLALQHRAERRGRDHIPTEQRGVERVRETMRDGVCQGGHGDFDQHAQRGGRGRGGDIRKCVKAAKKKQYFSVRRYNKYIYVYINKNIKRICVLLLLLL